jgi:DNA-directed RNA polymerase subunit RPC12/RpoP
MMRDEKSVVCHRCGKSFEASPRITPLGFQRFQCPECKGKITYPLLRSSVHLILLAAAALMLFFSLLGLYGGRKAEDILAFVILAALYVLERVSYILLPLAAWALLRLVGMYSPSVLQASRTLLYYTGIAALFGILIGILGGVASLIWAGRTIETLIASSALCLFFVFVLKRDRLMRKALTRG